MGHKNATQNHCVIFFLFMTSNHSTAAVPGLFSSSPGMFRACVQKHQASNQPLILVQTPENPEKGFFQLPFLPNLPELYGWDRDMEGTHCATNIPSSIQWDSYTTAPVPSTQTV